MAGATGVILLPNQILLEQDSNALFQTSKYPNNFKSGIVRQTYSHYMTCNVGDEVIYDANGAVIQFSQGGSETYVIVDQFKIFCKTLPA